METAMLSFECDYNKGAHPKILEALVRTNMEPCPGYGNDAYTERAREKIRAACGRANTKTFTKIAYLKPVTKFCYLGMHFLK